MECSRIASFNANGAFVVSTRVFGETFDDHKGTRLRGSGDGPGPSLDADGAGILARDGEKSGPMGIRGAGAVRIVNSFEARQLGLIPLLHHGPQLLHG
jgi:hypothetical protein